jgi:hypothetical protein
MADFVFWCIRRRRANTRVWEWLNRLELQLWFESRTGRIEFLTRAEAEVVRWSSDNGTGYAFDVVRVTRRYLQPPGRRGGA